MSRRGRRGQTLTVSTVPAGHTWVESEAPDGWLVSWRLVSQGGRPAVAEFRVRRSARGQIRPGVDDEMGKVASPADEPHQPPDEELPPGGLGMARLRDLARVQPVLDA